MNTAFALIATGGTIACTVAADGSLVPTVSGAQLAAEIDAAVEVIEFRQLDSSAITLNDLDELVELVHQQLDRPEISGVLITHGTDSMEETAMALSLFHPGTKPVVLTGAQRAFDHPGGDGPSNLQGAARVLADAAPGVFVHFGGLTIPGHAVRKQHTNDLRGFEELPVGPLETLPRRPLAPHPVAVVAAYPGADATLIDAAIPHFSGLVIEALGSGNMGAAMGEGVARALQAGLPVIISTRVPYGPTALAYGGDGGGATLASKGAVAGEQLRPGPARIVLAAALATGRDVESVLPRRDSSWR